jgi:hypothetical protein
LLLLWRFAVTPLAVLCSLVVVLMMEDDGLHSPAKPQRCGHTCTCGEQTIEVPVDSDKQLPRRGIYSV